MQVTHPLEFFELSDRDGDNVVCPGRAELGAPGRISRHEDASVTHVDRRGAVLLGGRQHVPVDICVVNQRQIADYRSVRECRYT